MVQRIFILIITALSLCSCNKGKLEWWEVVNTAPQRADKASGRNDNSDLNAYLFEKMDQLEASVAPYRLDTWIKSGNPWLVAANIVISILLIGLLIFGIVLLFHDFYSDWPRITAGILTTVLVLLYIPYYLFAKGGTTYNSIDFGPILGTIALVLCVPYVIDQDDMDTRRGTPVSIVFCAYFLVPILLVIGSMFRTVTTYGSYCFVFAMLVYSVVFIIRSVVIHAGFFRSVGTLLYLLITTLGAVVFMYSSMPCMISFFGDLFMVFIIFCTFSGIGESISHPRPSSTNTAEDDDKIIRYSPDDMKNTYKTDSDGNDVYKSEIDGKYYKHTWTGYEETDEPK